MCASYVYMCMVCVCMVCAHMHMVCMGACHRACLEVREHLTQFCPSTVWNAVIELRWSGRTSNALPSTPSPGLPQLSLWLRFVFSYGHVHHALRG